MSSESARRRVILGQVGAAFGVRGWLRVQVYTESPETLLQRECWQLGSGSSWSEYTILEGRVQAGSLVVRVEGVEDRDAARTLTGKQVALWRDELPEPDEGEFYFCDLEGLEVETIDGVSLGHVERVMETGANDVLVVRGDRERLIPLLWDRVVSAVDLEEGRLRVDWDPDF